MDEAIQRVFAQAWCGDDVRWRASQIQADQGLSEISPNLGSMTSGDLQIGQLGQRRIVFGDAVGGMKAFDYQQRSYFSMSRTDTVEFGRWGLPGSDRYIRYTPDTELEAHGSILVPDTVSHTAIQTYKRYAADFLASGSIISTDAEAYFNFELGAVGFGNELQGASGSADGWSITNNSDTTADDKAVYRFVHAYSGIDVGEAGWAATVGAYGEDYAVIYRAMDGTDDCAGLGLASDTAVHSRWYRDRFILTEGNARLRLQVVDTDTSLYVVLQAEDLRDGTIKGRILLGQGGISNLQEGDLYYDFGQHRWETHNGTAAYYLNMTAA